VNAKRPKEGLEFMTLTVCVCALFVILSNLYDETVQKWAIGVIAYVLGRGQR
jgi:hypothetical protein